MTPFELGFCLRWVVSGPSSEAIRQSIRVRRCAPRMGCCEARFSCVVHSSRQQKRRLGLIVPLLRNVMLQINLGLAILLLLTACSPEPRWVSVPNGKAGEFIDVSSIATAGPVRLASIKIVFTTPKSGDADQGNRRCATPNAFGCASAPPADGMQAASPVFIRSAFRNCAR